MYIFKYKILILAISFGVTMIGGAQVVINEVMYLPGPGSIFEGCVQSMVFESRPECGSEWIELYNPSPCHSVDLGCYFIGSRTRVQRGNTGIYHIPEGTILKPLGFLTIGGPKSGADLIVNDGTYCTQSGRWFLENNGGWVALYAPDKSPVDMAYWTEGFNSENDINVDNRKYDLPLYCLDGACQILLGAAPSARQINNTISGNFHAGYITPQGLSLRRIPDGGPWSGHGEPTIGRCNADCIVYEHLEIECTLVDSVSIFGARDGRAQIQLSGGAAPYVISWKEGHISNFNKPETILNGLSPDIYQVTITDYFDCETVCELKIPQAGCKLTLDLIAIDENCFEACDAAIQPVITNETGVITYQWDSGSAEPFLEEVCPGDYKLMIRDGLDCIEEATTFIAAAGEIVLSLGEPISSIPGRELIVSAQTNLHPTAIHTFSWEPADELNCIRNNNCNSVSITPYESLILDVTLMDTTGCLSNASLQIDINEELFVFIPNIFTPNNDNINDIFEIFHNNSVVKILSMEIFDRWGNRVYEVFEKDIKDPYGWDGSFNGRELDSGVYVYSLEVEFLMGERRYFKGEVNLQR